MGKQPSFQFYPGDWKRDAGVQSLSFEERGVWFEMMLLMFESAERGKLVFGTGTPMPEDAVARSLGLDRQKYVQILRKLLDYGVASKEEETGIIYCRRMVRDAELSRKRAECGKLGGNPNLLNQNSSKRKAKSKQSGKQSPTPSSSSSISLKKEKNKKEKDLEESAERIWKVYPKKDGKQEGIKAILKCLQAGKSEAYLLDRVKAYCVQCEGKEKGYIKNAQGWFNNARYEDASLDNPAPPAESGELSLKAFRLAYRKCWEQDFAVDHCCDMPHHKAVLAADYATLRTDFRADYEDIKARYNAPFSPLKKYVSKVLTLGRQRGL